MTEYPISDSLAASYRGSGEAVAAIRGGAVVDLIYVRDLRVEAARRELQRLADRGALRLGMCSCWTFIDDDHPPAAVTAHAMRRALLNA